MQSNAFLDYLKNVGAQVETVVRYNKTAAVVIAMCSFVVGCVVG